MKGVNASHELLLYLYMAMRCQKTADHKAARRIYESDLEYYEWCINAVQEAQGTILEAKYEMLDCGERPIPPAGVSRPLNETRTGPIPSNQTGGDGGPLSSITESLEDIFGEGNQTDGRISTANETIGNITRTAITTPPSNVSDNVTTPVTGLQEGGLRVEFDTFIVPGSSSEFGNMNHINPTHSAQMRQLNGM